MANDPNHDEAIRIINQTIEELTKACSKETADKIVKALRHIDHATTVRFVDALEAMRDLMLRSEKPLKFKPHEDFLDKTLSEATRFDEVTPPLNDHLFQENSLQILVDFIERQIKGAFGCARAYPEIADYFLEAYFSTLHLDLRDAEYDAYGRLQPADLEDMKRRLEAVKRVPVLQENLRHASWVRQPKFSIFA